MIQTFFFLIFLIITDNVACATSLGYIYNASYASNDIQTFLTYKTSCSECICNAFFSDVLPVTKGLNCYTSNKTCGLFANYSSPSMIRVNLDSTFIFIQMPPSQNTTTITYPLMGVTVAGYSNGTSGSNTDALTTPWGLAIDLNDTLYISDCGNARVIKLRAGFLNGSVVAGVTGASGSSYQQLGCAAELKLDNHSNIYVDDNSHCRVMLWRRNASSGVIAAGNGTCGNTNSTFGTSIGLALDSQGNLYVSDTTNHRVMKWPPNATTGIVVAGKTGVSGSSNQLLNGPYGLYLDEQNSYLYIADTGNNRIQQYRLGITANGTIVAGGNGGGSNSNQLNGPHGVYVSKKTGDIYIADRVNNRIQRWSPGASSGMTIAGVTGVSGTDATMLNSPVVVIMNMNETFLYVSDRGNNRTQRYPVI